MDVALRGMTPDEFERFWERQEHEYVASLSASRTPDAARRKAREDRARLVPDGLATAGHRFLTVEDPHGRPVGQVWLGPADDAADTAWLYEIRVDEDRRSRGYGRAVLTAVERVARDDGARRLGLNVFGDNHAAIALYASAGYAVTAQQMAKTLA